MRRITISFVLAVFAVSCLNAQDLDKILNDHFKASAQDKISEVKSVIINGKNVAMGMEMGITLYQSRPNKLRIEAEFAGSKMIQTFNGTSGWTYAPAMGISPPMEMGADDLKALLNQTEIDSPLWDYKAKGKTAELTGSTEDGSAHMIKLSDAEGDALTICINKKTYLISKILTTQSVNGVEANIEVVMKDYKTVKGIPSAHYMATKMDGQVVTTMTFESIEYNKPIDPSQFEKPAVN